MNTHDEAIVVAGAKREAAGSASANQEAIEVAGAKQEALRAAIARLGSVAVAFSGGVDSTFLLKTAHDLLGERAIAVTARSCSFPVRELSEARAFCAGEGITHVICDSEELEIPGFATNPVNRCYLCKNELFEKIWAVARARDIEHVAEGSNMDDNGDFRPGLKAVAEQGVKSPLREAGLTKAEIRLLSKALGLPTWDKPSFACLASRFVYGENITTAKLRRVDQAEQLLLDLGFRQARVRIHGNIARIELEEAELARAAGPDCRQKIYPALKELGFAYVTLDLGGYRTGSMNETLTDADGAKAEGRRGG
ncbi:MAG: ATP-dependent sacrificial sulfur transferase LarE [Peptococcaceae bacterium]|jgi:uncharacterized protein|nr:ATP-dependent sacrificial sulfur transferase LarE [Peptococcaceae bacterium]